MINLITTTPPKGKFIALFADGSGCSLFRTNSDGRFSSPSFENDAVNIEWLLDAGYLHWIALPDDYKIWREE
jgi:hypothetical protein